MEEKNINVVYEEEDTKVSKILIVINLIIWSLIVIICIIWSSVVNASTIDANKFTIQSINSNWGIGNTVYDTTSLYSNNAMGFQFFPTTGSNYTPVEESEYYINMRVELAFYSDTIPPIFQEPIINIAVGSGYTNATCDGYQDKKLTYDRTANNYYYWYLDYVCDNLKVTQNFDRIRVRIYNTNYNNQYFILRQLTINEFQWLDQNDLNNGDKYIGNKIDENAEEIIKNQNNIFEKTKEYWGEATYTPTTPQQSEYNDYKTKENTLKTYTDNLDFNSINVGIDGNSSNWVWSTMTTLFNTNALVFGMIISILSVGIMKLILNR